jgi:predicted ATPase
MDGDHLEDLGTHYLKDLAEPEHVFEVRHPDLPVVTAPIRTVDPRRHNLPDYLTSFVGRQQQLGELAGLIAGSRLVALTGVGGTGKTRLAVEAARAAAAELPDGAWLVELAPVTNPQLVMTAIGDIWGLRPGEGATIEQVITRYLWSRDLLLIVDNCEHLLDAAAAAIKDLLDACPKLRIIATSRESLGIVGESILRVPSLGLSHAPHSLAESEAAQLFLDRARAVRRGFDPADDELVDIDRICTRIDGIPLGLELAAARLRSMSPAELADRLDESFRILSGSAKTALPRQRTLHATIDWSYDLLKPAERAMFRRLSVFAGGLNAAAAESICVGDEVESGQVVDLLDSLVDKSLVVPSHTAESGTRYRLLEPVRQYAQENLSVAGEAERFRAAHARYYVEFTAEASPGLRGPNQIMWMHRIDLDYDNIRAALVSLLEAGDLEPYLGMLFDLYTYMMQRGMQMEAIDVGLAGLALASDEVAPELIVKAWYTTARFGAELTRPSGIEHARQGLAVARATGNPNLIGRMEVALGTCIRHATTDPEYLEHLLEGRRLLEAHPEPRWWEPVWESALRNLLMAAYLPADDERLEEHMLAALAGFEECGDRLLLAATLADSAGAYGEGDRDLDEWALGNVRRACAILADMGSPNWYGHALYYMGILLRYEGECAEAMENLAMGATRLDDVGDANCWAGASRTLASCEVRTGSTDSAADRLLAVIDRMPLLPMQEVAKPRTLDVAAELLFAVGSSARAAITLGSALAPEIPAEYNKRRLPELQALRDRLGEVLGVEEMERLVAEGDAFDLDDAIRTVRGWLQEL